MSVRVIMEAYAEYLKKKKGFFCTREPEKSTKSFLFGKSEAWMLFAQVKSRSKSAVNPHHL